MLRVAKVAQGGHGYYLEVAAGTGSGVEPAGRWLGAGARSLGLGGTVDGDALGALLAGDDPVTGRRLGPAHHRVTVAAFDLSFCAPKSVSLLHALGPPGVSDQVRASHGAAVDAALDYVERRALAVRRRGREGAVPVAADAVASAGFLHRTSRALDPHLHSHVVLANLGRGPEGRFSALDGRGVYAHAPAAGALYHVQLRHELTRRLGVAWEPLRDGRADIAGIGPEVRSAFSRRAAAIAEHLAGRGLTGRRATVIAGHATRPRRDAGLAAEDLVPWWEERARAVGLGPERLASVVGRVAGRDRAGPHDADRTSRVAREVAESLAGRGPSAVRRDVVRQWCASLPAGAPAAQVEEAADRLLGSWSVVAAHEGRVERPGVGERRRRVEGRERAAPDGVVPGGPGRGVGRDHGLEAMLARRGTRLDLGRPGAGRAVDDDRGLGLG